MQNVPSFDGTRLLSPLLNTFSYSSAPILYPVLAVNCQEASSPVHSEHLPPQTKALVLQETRAVIKAIITQLSELNTLPGLMLSVGDTMENQTQSLPRETPLQWEKATQKSS